MEPEIITITEKKLIGKRLTMTFADNKTLQLWQSFMPVRHKIKNNLNSELISMQVYGPSFDFNPHKPFEKWAAFEVADLDTIPEEMESFILPGGLYAVFHYKGLNTDTEIFKFIFGEWLPNSGYALDNRPHFEILGEKYKNNDPNSEEDIWIPVRVKE